MARQGDHEPWVNTQNYLLDRKAIREAPLEDGVLVFTNPVKSGSDTSTVSRAA
jgi:hypothetical protein